MPMDKKSTSVTASSKKTNSTKKAPKVSEKTLAMLRSFAYNYYVEPSLPQGMQGIILG